MFGFRSAPSHTPSNKQTGHILLALLFIWFVPGGLVIAQNIGSVSGFVHDSETEETLPSAHVYLANTTIGDIADPNGFFNIEDVQAGNYLIIITMIGYKPLQQSVEILPGSNTDLSFELEKDIYKVGEITVTDSRPRSWRRELTRFKRMFLGNTPNRRGCELENPFVLSFEKTDGRFEASASMPIEIINKAIGYKLTYHLSTFSASGNEFRYTGYPTFEELEPKDEKEANKWRERREETYVGSFQHFLRSLAAGTVEEEGFQLYLYRYLRLQQPHRELMDFMEDERTKVTIDALLKDHPHEHERALQFPGYLHVFYMNEIMHRDFYESVTYHYKPTKEPVRAAIRLIHLEAVFNEIGFLNSSFDVARYGYWNWESGICNWLPFNYGLESSE